MPLVACLLPDGRIDLDVAPENPDEVAETVTLFAALNDTERFLARAFSKDYHEGILAMAGVGSARTRGMFNNLEDAVTSEVPVDRTSRMPLAPPLEFWTRFCGNFLRQLLLLPDIEVTRGTAVVPLEEEVIRHALATAPLMDGYEVLDTSYLRGIWGELHEAFAGAIAKTHVGVEAWAGSLTPNSTAQDKIHFHLVEDRRDPFRPFAFLATYAARLPGYEHPRQMPLRRALREYHDDSRRLIELMAAVRQASNNASFLRELLEKGEIFHPLRFTAEESLRFLREAPVYAAAGILCRLPAFWKGGATSPRLNVVLDAPQEVSLGAHDLCTFDMRLNLDGESISEAEARHLLQGYDTLVMLKGRWVAFDPEGLKNQLDRIDQLKEQVLSQKMTVQEALKLLASWSKGQAEKLLGDDDDGRDLDFVAGGQLAGLLANLRLPPEQGLIQPPADFKAVLRPYQHAGLQWLHLLHRLGLGGCLADDMGLGKTVQVLAWLCSLKDRGEAGKSPTLLVAPASLIGNWVRESRRFSPKLKLFVAHGQYLDNDAHASTGKPDLKKVDLVITTYGMAARLDWIEKTEWARAVLDEAQAIKNPSSNQSKAVKRIKAGHRLLLTGTPVENRLNDLWSLFDFAQPGLLGTASAFKSFAKQIAKDPEGYSRLRSTLQPYILRRLKTDPKVIADLPEKTEIKSMATLTKVQASHYQRMVKGLADELEQSDGMKRRGVVLTYLMRFKQLCNHPDHLLGLKGYDPAQSGKFELLRTLAEEIFARRERLLLFTQFREITGPLNAFLAGIAGREGLVLHGGTSIDDRRKIVDNFQGHAWVPFLVLTVKAGGVGLNLTAASHVIHFDRWWNPAVENQATDRAYRIGQDKRVMVHKFVTEGTVEERIDQLIESKLSMASQVIGASDEAWITEMKNDELLDMFRLGALPVEEMA